MTTPQQHRPDRRPAVRARRFVTAGLALALTVTGMPAPAQAVVPGVAQTRSVLMYRSLTVDAEAALLRRTLATQRNSVRSRAADVAAARPVHDAAQAHLAKVLAADVAARARRTAAAQHLGTARKALHQASRRRPRSNAAVTRANAAVITATTTLKIRTKQAHQAGTALTAAKTRARTASTGLSAATAAWQSGSAAATRTQQKLAGLSTAAALAGQAAALSRDVVTQVRARFTVSDTIAVYGVTVHKSVSYAFKRMLDDARADGIVMSGGGFRTTQRQIELRRINGCPDVWTAPASSCRVPTAIPGRSLHEIGLAVDITAGGRSLTAASPAFTWLVAHADEYGFVNLPSEPWHWSVTGG